MDQEMAVEEVFAKQYPAQLDGEEVAEETTFTWTIDKWSDLPEKALSVPFQVGGRRWRTLLFPEGNGTQGTRGAISLFLKLLHSEDEAEQAADADPNQEDKDLAGIGDSELRSSRLSADRDTDMASLRDTEDDALQVLDPDVAQVVTENGKPAYALIKTGPTGIAGSTASDGGVCIQAALIMWNPDHPEVHLAQHIQKRYDNSVQDWGYSQFTDVRSAVNPGIRGTPIIDNDRVNVTVIARVFKDPTGMLWRDDFRDYDSKKTTGYIGLLNQGATCYLNSLIQSLYFTKVFRHTVYNMLCAKGDTVAGNLQLLFFNLGTSKSPVGTLALTRAFGWDSADAFTQHDVQELNRVLMDRLETSLKGTSYAGALSEMFVGQMKSFIKCINIDFESARVEDFWDIQLNVRGCKDVYESFDKYIESELLTGENQYQATDHGLQDAKKGVIFESFPPVLHLQLKRYDYDYMRDIEVKINDRYEFPLELDLAPYIYPESEANKTGEPWKYELHGVLVHSGDLNAGHYYALIKPEAEGDWYRFDDDFVTKASLSEVLEANFGGESLSSGNNGMSRGIKRITSAYMLVYVRKSRLDFVFPRGDDKVPSEVLEHAQSELTKDRRYQEALRERQMHTQLRILTSQNFQQHSSIGLASWVGGTQRSSAPEVLRVKRSQTVQEFFDRERTARNLPSSTSLWLVPSRENGARRMNPLRGVMDAELDRLSQWSDDQQPVVWFEEKTGDLDEQILVFIKEYNARKQKLQGHGTRWINRSDTLANVFAQTSDVVRIAIYHEVKGTLIPLNLEARVRDTSLELGSIIVVETRGSGTPDMTLPEGQLSASYFYKLLNHKINIMLTERKQLVREGPLETSQDSEQGDGANGESKSAPIVITGSTMDSYPLLAARIGKALSVDPSYLALFVPLYSRLAPLKSDGSNLGSLTPSATTSPDELCKIVYEILDRPLVEHENYMHVAGSWFGESFAQAKVVPLELHKSGTIGGAIEQLVKAAEIPKDQQANLQVWSSRYRREIVDLGPESTTEEALPNPGTHGVVAELYARVMPSQELRIKDGKEPGKLTTVFHFHKQDYATHSVPFTFALLPGEPWEITKDRLRKLLGYSEKVFENIPVAVVTSGRDSTLTYIESDAEVLYDIMRPGDILGLDHADRRKHQMRSAIVIK